MFNHLDNGQILITGAAGFIGSALAWHLNREGYQNLLLVDQLGTDERWKNLRALRFADYMEIGEFRKKFMEDPARLSEVGTIFHLGACSATTEKDASYLADNNYAFSRDLMLAAVENACRFIYASSAATYGDGSEGYDDDADHIDKLRPLNAYGYSKHMIDQFAAQRGLFQQVVALKYFNVFGPNENHKADMMSLVGKAWKQVRETGKIRLFKSYRPEYADGGQQRDFLYVKDAVRMTTHFASHATSSGGIFNLGSGSARSWNDLAYAIFSAMKRDPQIEYIEMPEVLKDKYQYHTCADLTRLRESGYQTPVHSLEDAVADTIQNYLEPGKFLGDG